MCLTVRFRTRRLIVDDLDNRMRKLLSEKINHTPCRHWRGNRLAPYPPVQGRAHRVVVACDEDRCNQEAGPSQLIFSLPNVIFDVPHAIRGTDANVFLWSREHETRRDSVRRRRLFAAAALSFWKCQETLRLLLR